MQGLVPWPLFLFSKPTTEFSGQHSISILWTKKSVGSQNVKPLMLLLKVKCTHWDPIWPNTHQTQPRPTFITNMHWQAMSYPGDMASPGLVSPWRVLWNPENNSVSGHTKTFFILKRGRKRKRGQSGRERKS